MISNKKYILNLSISQREWIPKVLQKKTQSDILKLTMDGNQEHYYTYRTRTDIEEPA